MSIEGILVAAVAFAAGAAVAAVPFALCGAGRAHDLESLVDSQDELIEELRAKLCRDGHEWVRVGSKTSFAGCCVDVEPVYLCTRCGARKEGREVLI